MGQWSATFYYDRVYPFSVSKIISSSYWKYGVYLEAWPHWLLGLNTQLNHGLNYKSV